VAYDILRGMGGPGQRPREADGIVVCDVAPRSRSGWGKPAPGLLHRAGRFPAPALA